MQSLFARRAALLGLAFAFGAAWVAAPASAQRTRPGRNVPTRGNNPRLPAGAVLVTGTISALGANAATVQITTDHGTAVTLTTNTSTQLQPNGTIKTLANLAVGQAVQAIYKPADKIALALVAAAPATGAVSGAITAIDLTGGTLQLTPLAGSPQTIKLNAQTQFSLNGRRVAPSVVAVGQLATVRSATDGTTTSVAAETPPLVDLLGTISALNVSGTPATMEVTTQAATTITLQLDNAPVQRNGAAAKTADLAVGDQVEVLYEYRLLPGASTALTITAKATAPATTPTTTPTPAPTPAAAAVSVSLSPTSVKGGTSTTGTVTLNAAAPTTGTMVTLASSNPAVASVPGSVTVAAGATTATFTVTTTAVTANTPVTLFASSGGAIGMATLTVTP